ncbi:MAG: phosphatase PAP2 family protein [Bacteriovoracaceae bacterium]|nr:phosphatase PAP2 family protein [Bacteriovoracaceae bacterium]
MKFIFLILFFLTTNLFAEDSPKIEPKDLQYNAKSDFVESLEWAYKGSYKQFQSTQNLIFFGIAALSTSYFVINDDRLSKQAVKQNKNEKLLRIISDASIFFNTPVVPFSFYAIGRSNNDSHMIQFSKEYFAAQVLTLLETAAISLVPVHQRPDRKELSFWEKAFRGQSSFPSGHVVGYSVLAVKSFQFYGPHYGFIPFTFALATAFERVHGEKHYASDVVASGFLSFLACEGVRYSAGYKKNNSIYNWFFEHDFSLDYIRKDSIPGLRVSLTF